MNFFLPIRHLITVCDHHLSKKACRASGPGGQAINKTNSKIQYRFNLWNATWIPEETKFKIKKYHQDRLTKHGDIVFECQDTPSPLTNSKICLKNISDFVNDVEQKPLEDPVKKVLIKEWIHEIKSPAQISARKNKLIDDKRRASEKRKLKSKTKLWD